MREVRNAGRGCNIAGGCRKLVGAQAAGDVQSRRGDRQHVHLTGKGTLVNSPAKPRRGCLDVVGAVGDVIVNLLVPRSLFQEVVRL